MWLCQQLLKSVWTRFSGKKTPGGALNFQAVPITWRQARPPARTEHKRPSARLETPWRRRSWGFWSKIVAFIWFLYQKYGTCEGFWCWRLFPVCGAECASSSRAHQSRELSGILAQVCHGSFTWTVYDLQTDNLLVKSMVPHNCCHTCLSDGTNEIVEVTIQVETW